MARRRPSQGRVFAFSLSEVTLLLAFLLLSLLAATVSDMKGYDEMVQEREQNSHFRDEVEGVLDSLGTSLDELRRVASVLVAADLAEEKTIVLLRVINQLIESNRGLRKALADLRSELAEQDSLSGTEPGSCWTDEDGRTQYLLSITIDDTHFKLEPDWPDTREADFVTHFSSARQPPTGEISRSQLLTYAKPVYAETLMNNCRFIVKLIDQTTTKEHYKHQRAVLESYFFVFEVNSN